METLPVSPYADEDCPGPVVCVLRAAGFDIIAQREVKHGAPDDDVLRLSEMAGRVLITRDLGFGRLTVLQGMPAVGVIIIPLRGKATGPFERSASSRPCGRSGKRVGHISTIDWHMTRARPLDEAE